MSHKRNKITCPFFRPRYGADCSLFTRRPLPFPSDPPASFPLSFHPWASKFITFNTEFFILLYLPGPFPGLLASIQRLPSTLAFPGCRRFHASNSHSDSSLQLAHDWSELFSKCCPPLVTVDVPLNPGIQWPVFSPYCESSGTHEKAVPVGDISGASAGYRDSIPLDTPVQKPQ